MPAIHENNIFDPTDPIVLVKCDDDEVKFKIHYSVLQEAGLDIKLPRVELGEDQPDFIDLTLDVPSDGFRVLVGWIYYDKVHQDDVRNSFCEDLVALLQAYKAGAELGADSSFLNEVMDEFVQGLAHQDWTEDNYPAGDWLMEALAAFSEGSVAREFLADWIAHYPNIHTHGEEGAIAEVIEKSGASFSSLVLKSVLKKQPQPPWDDPCAYHEHKHSGRATCKRRQGWAVRDHEQVCDL